MIFTIEIKLCTEHQMMSFVTLITVLVMSTVSCCPQPSLNTTHMMMLGWFFS